MRSGHDGSPEVEADVGRFAGTPDPYEVLRVARHASWDEILAAYRRQVRWWHPDGLRGASPAEREACEERIRVLNGAYYELRVRRGR